MEESFILGIDPGTRFVGWAVIARSAKGQMRYVAGGTWRLGGSHVDVGLRLQRLQVELEGVLEEYDLACVALESAFFGKNARSALRIGEARGVILVAAAGRSIPLLDVPPALVKRRVAGGGAASKAQIAEMVRVQLHIPESLSFDTEDASDAAAVALCGAIETSSSVPHQGEKRCKLPPGASFQ